MIKNLGIEPTIVKENSKLDLEIRYMLAIANNLKALGLSSLVEKVVNVYPQLREGLSNEEMVVSLREEVLKEPYRMLVKPLRSHLGGLSIEEQHSRKGLDRGINKIILYSLRLLSTTKIFFPRLLRGTNSKILQVLVEKDEWEEYGKVLKKVWEEIYYIGRLSPRTIRRLTEVSKIYSEAVYQEASKINFLIKTRYRVIKMFTYALYYGTMAKVVANIIFNKDINVNTITDLILMYLSHRVLSGITRTEKEYLKHEIKEIKSLSIPHLVAISVHRGSD